MKFKLIIFLLLTLGYSSCVPYKEIEIQYLNKPEFDIPSSFYKPLLIINYYDNKSKTKKEKFEYALDSVAAWEAVNSLKENLEESPWFEGLDIPIKLYKRIDSSKYIKPLSWNYLNSIAAKDSIDLIISLEYLKIQEKTDSYRTRNNDGIEYYYGYLELPIYCYWRVYDLSKKQIPNGYLYRDTLIWDANDWIPVTVGKQLPGYFNAAAYAGGDSGEKYANKISPVWNDDNRIFFHSGSKEMEKAAIYVSKDQWIDAAVEWQKVLSVNKGKLKAKAAFNLSLANEMLGKFDLSIEWLKNARKYYPLLEIDEYQKTIENRIKLIPN
ncbi:MAG: DUF6340 family protein [Tenuifilaceae bacterium]